MRFFNSDSKTHQIWRVLMLYVVFFQQLLPLTYARTQGGFYHPPVFRAPAVLSVAENDGVNTAVKQTEMISGAQALRSFQAASGPGQAESSNFSLASTDGMVNKFTGDFSYSIPLMDVEGYPVVLQYNSNVNMHTEASWVGLGWDLNIGSVSRDMRGVPDEFNGSDIITRTYNQKVDVTENGFKAGGYLAYGRKEIGTGKFLANTQLTLLKGKYFNSYLGNGRVFDIGLQASFSTAEDNFYGGRFGLGYSSDSKNGIGKNKTFGISGGHGPAEGIQASGGLSYGTNFNSRRGMVDQSFGLNFGGGAASSKHLSVEAGYSTSASVTYGSATSIPRVTISSASRSTSGNFDIYGGIKKGKNLFKAGIIINNFTMRSGVTLTDNKLYQPAFGYLHSGKRGSYEGTGSPVMDFNRSSEFEFSESMKNLPFSIQTYDLFYVNGMGISGTFRARRSDFGTYYDPETVSEMNGGKYDGDSFGDLIENLATPDVGQVSAGIVKSSTNEMKVELGAALGYQKGNVISANWKAGTNSLGFTHNTYAPFTREGTTFDKETYFKAVGEPTPENMQAYDMMGGSVPAYFDVNASNKAIDLTTAIKYGNATVPVNSGTLNVVTGRPVTATIFRPKTSNEIELGEGTYKSTAFLGSSYAGQFNTTIERNLPARRNHITVIDVISTAGTKYKYGIPVYTLNQSEVSFTATGLDYDLSKGLVTYNSGGTTPDNSVKNVRGISNFYDKTELPAYPNAFLLTAMTSADYIDRLNDGPTLDDIGNYYKFNHTRVYNDVNPYRWRFPVSGGDSPKASFSRGKLGTTFDDMGHYTYGTKEIWYTHSIETKNLVAEFILEPRQDAYGVKDENGKLDTLAPLFLLRKIVLYSRADSSVLQTVEFSYDYSLCLASPSNKNTYNNGPAGQSGKLTLKEIRVYQGTSMESALSPFRFEYSSINPSFSYTAVDGWGNYKPYDPALPGDVYPYALQDAASANQNIQAWKLVAINNPMGGRMEVSYAADKYGFVQNKRAMRHFKIAGMTNIFDLVKLQNTSTWNGVSNMYPDFSHDFSDAELSVLFGSASTQIKNTAFGVKPSLPYMQEFGSYDKKAVPNNVLIFKLDTPIAAAISTDAAGQQVKDAYFKANATTYMEELFIKAHVHVERDNPLEEIIPTFSKISKDYKDPLSNIPNFEDDFKAIGVMPKNSASNNYEYGYVVLNPVNSVIIEAYRDKEEADNPITLHPVQRAALDFIRQNLPDKVYGTCPDCEGETGVDLQAAFGHDIYRYMAVKKNYVPDFISGLTTLRLFEPDNEKFGGNARVSQIVYKDNWQPMSGEYTSQYTWNYSYATPRNETGVAAYEGKQIQDENPFYMWDSYLNFAKRFPDESNFNTTPIADALYPVPIVGYAETRLIFGPSSKYGYAAAYFYTSKDKPTVFSTTGLDKSAEYKKRNILTGTTMDLFGLTQGYFVQTNDFHGKIKESRLYNDHDHLQSRSTYNYTVSGEKVKMLDRAGTLSEEEISLEYDIHADSRYIQDENHMIMAGFTFSLKLPTMVPGIEPIFFRTARERSFYAHTTIKHINRSAVLKSVQTEYLGSINDAENLVYDRFTGNVLLSSLKDEYNDTLYNLQYPAHWYYNELRDIGGTRQMTFDTCIINAGKLVSSSMDLQDYLVPGDVLLVKLPSQAVQKVWVYELLPLGGVSLILENGTLLTGTGNCTVELSSTNRDNRLAEIMQSVVTKKSPLPTDATDHQMHFPVSAADDVLSSSAIGYGYRDNFKCGKSFTPTMAGLPYDSGVKGNNNQTPANSVVNPFLFGIRGNLIVDAQYVWQNERTQNSHPHKTRFDGKYVSYAPFYSLNTYSAWQALSSDLFSWRKLGKISVYDQYGKPLESMDQLGMSAAALYGYNRELNLLPVAQAVNARQQDIAFDGFEDYGYYAGQPIYVTESHFDFYTPATKAGTGVTVTSSTRHSGLRSLRVEPLKQAEVIKKVDVGCVPPTNIPPLGAKTYKVDSCQCIKPFMPTPGEYVISAWTKEKNTGISDTTYTKTAIVVRLGTDSLTFFPSGKIIDGWQRLEGSFTIPSSAATIRVALKNLSGTNNVYFDDLRIHPFLAGMTTIVYDPKTLLPMATHDGYNFTTFYNYDENLNQVRVRVETTEGIQTVVESESGGQKIFKP